ncbi:MAG: hypothetical protein KF784_06620 [Fimbriimonadaceae bacterium]|nr:hypothetical protein [Fimbriimonadaceae bacterium]
MANYISWYLVELERRLKGKLPTRKVIELQSEVEDHLRLSAEEVQRQGVEPMLAERLAIESFGNPRQFVHNTIRNLCAGHVSPRMLSAQSILTVIIITSFGYVGIQRDSSTLGLAALLLIPYAIISFITKRVPLKLSLGYSIILTPLLMVFAGYTMLSGSQVDSYVSRSNASEYIQYRNAERKNLEHSLDVLRTGILAYGLSPSAPNDTLVVGERTSMPSELMHNGEFVIPQSFNSGRLPFYRSTATNENSLIFTRSSGAETVANLAEAKKFWKMRAHDWEQLIVRAVHDNEVDTARMRSLIRSNNLDGHIAVHLGAPAILWGLGFMLPSSIVPVWFGWWLGFLKLKRRAMA